MANLLSPYWNPDFFYYFNWDAVYSGVTSNPAPPFEVGGTHNNFKGAAEIHNLGVRLTKNFPRCEKQVET